MKKVVGILIAVMMVLSCMGCAEITETVIVNSNDAFMSIEMLMDKEQVDTYTKAMGITDTDIFKCSTVVQKDGKEYYRITDDISQSFDELWQNYKQLVTEYSIYAPQTSLTSYLESLTKNKGQEVSMDVDRFKSMIKKCELTVKFNQIIETTNGDKIDGNTVKWDYINNDFTEIYAYCEGAETNLEKDREIYQSKIEDENTPKNWAGEREYAGIGTLKLTGKQKGEEKYYVSKAVFKFKSKKDIKIKSIYIKKNDKKVKKTTKYYNKKKRTVTFSSKGNWNFVVKYRRNNKLYQASFRSPVKVKKWIKCTDLYAIAGD